MNFKNNAKKYWKTCLGKMIQQKKEEGKYLDWKTWYMNIINSHVVKIKIKIIIFKRVQMSKQTAFLISEKTFLLKTEI